MTDRAALERAIQTLQGWWCHGSTQHFDASDQKRIEIVCAAARAHLETLPKTKMVEKFHVESVSAISDACYVVVCDDQINADATALRMRENHRAVRVTGPHLHEVPST